MKLLLQKNIWQEHAYDRFIASLDNAGIEFLEVGVIPFTENFPERVDFEPDAIFGSGRFVNICRAKGYPTFPSFDPIEDFYPRYEWVNYCGQQCRYDQLPDVISQALRLQGAQFVKPFTEKFFTGMVIESEEDLEKIQLASSFLEDEGAEMVRVSPAVNLGEEVRFFILNGQIISGSVYKDRGIAKQYRVDENHPSWAAAKEIIRKHGEITFGFVMDLGLVNGEEWRIVELNNLNSSGLYQIDTDAFVNALKQLYA